MTQRNPIEPELLAEIARLHQEIEILKLNNQDLQTALSTVLERGSAIETQLHAANQKLQTETMERQQVQTVLKSLLDMLHREKHDLEVIVETIMEHGDVLDAQWAQKLRKANLLAASDGLTEIPNRRGFDAHLNKQWKLMLREQLPISLILCDVDFFKSYNDCYGHIAGDSCLKNIAQTLSSSLSRPSDLVARYGGEEFAVVLPRTDEAGALNVASRMQAEIHQIKIPHGCSPINSYITLSMGVACTIPAYDQSPNDLVDQADQLLYQAKQEGRNQIIHNFVY